ncbi:hypothetical protein P0M04_24910 [Telluria mixta]|uniref:hypothetical protein n=1 Tax=Telluria mixta TaxID=34071 RepID=UPI00247A88B6|nr:hypothetical protein [Telluria mixta]WEM94711.1 hypothetical protein P0M04_24910 [Telluria mixta]
MSTASRKGSRASARLVNASAASSASRPAMHAPVAQPMRCQMRRSGPSRDDVSGRVAASARGAHQTAMIVATTMATNTKVQSASVPFHRSPICAAWAPAARSASCMPRACAAGW